MGANQSMGKSDMMQKNDKSGKATTTQCAVINPDGKKCPGMAEEGSKYCLMHKDYKK
jgi:hypothetical protein